MKKAIFRGSLM